MEIEIKENIVYIYKEEDREDPIYSIREDELGETLDSNGHKISDWVNQLLQKTWIEYHILYDLARIIQKTIPINSIDWFNTFCIVEKSYYLNHVKNTKELGSTVDTNLSQFNSLQEAIKRGIEEQNDIINNHIAEIVESQLVKYGLK